MKIENIILLLIGAILIYEVVEKPLTEKLDNDRERHNKEQAKEKFEKTWRILVVLLQR